MLTTEGLMPPTIFETLVKTGRTLNDKNSLAAKMVLVEGKKIIETARHLNMSKQSVFNAVKCVRTRHNSLKNMINQIQQTPSQI